MIDQLSEYDKFFSAELYNNHFARIKSAGFDASSEELITLFALEIHMRNYVRMSADTGSYEKALSELQKAKDTLEYLYVLRVNSGDFESKLKPIRFSDMPDPGPEKK